MLSGLMLSHCSSRSSTLPSSSPSIAALIALVIILLVFASILLSALHPPSDLRLTQRETLLHGDTSYGLSRRSPSTKYTRCPPPTLKKLRIFSLLSLNSAEVYLVTRPGIGSRCLTTHVCSLRKDFATSGAAASLTEPSYGWSSVLLSSCSRGSCRQYWLPSLRKRCTRFRGHARSPCSRLASRTPDSGRSGPSSLSRVCVTSRRRSSEKNLIGGLSRMSALSSILRFTQSSKLPSR
mmetsp:Transcript_9321/g.18845  ORF Transcript_9321/g.18845 Transcript_9321/m.18845 type:complete len:237 (+) Transcript_9321:1314-2024(+)